MICLKDCCVTCWFIASHSPSFVKSSNTGCSSDPPHSISRLSVLFIITPVSVCQLVCVCRPLSHPLICVFVRDPYFHRLSCSCVVDSTWVTPSPPAAWFFCLIHISHQLAPSSITKDSYSFSCQLVCSLKRFVCPKAAHRVCMNRCSTPVYSEGSWEWLSQYMPSGICGWYAITQPGPFAGGP